MGATVSTVPAILTELVRLFALAAPDAEVSDGQPTNNADDYIMVGFTGTPGEASVTETRDRAQMASSPDHEQYDVISLVSGWHGSEDDAAAIAAARARAYELVGVMAAELARDQTLGRRVLSARLTSGNLTQYLSDGGASADVQVVISVDAFTRRN
jgi:hypothetical protein